MQPGIVSPPSGSIAPERLDSPTPLRGEPVDVLRTRLAASAAALAFAAVALPACGDDDGKGAAEEINQGVKKGAKGVEKQGNEIDDDLKGRDERKQRDK